MPNLPCVRGQAGVHFVTLQGGTMHLIIYAVMADFSKLLLFTADADFDFAAWLNAKSTALAKAGIECVELAVMKHPNQN